MKHDVQVEALNKLREIFNHAGEDLDSVLYHDLRDLIGNTIQAAYKAGAEFYKETSGIKIGLERMGKSRQFKGKFANLKQLDDQRTPGKWYRAHEGIYSGSGLKDLVATCYSPGKEFADARFLTALVDIWPMIQEVLDEGSSKRNPTKG